MENAKPQSTCVFRGFSLPVFCLGFFPTSISPSGGGAGPTHSTTIPEGKALSRKNRRNRSRHAGLRTLDRSAQRQTKPYAVLATKPAHIGK